VQGRAGLGQGRAGLGHGKAISRAGLGLVLWPGQGTGYGKGRTRLRSVECQGGAVQDQGMERMPKWQCQLGPGQVLGRASAGQGQGKNRTALGHGRAGVWHG
jgi:hypothetical protein